MKLKQFFEWYNNLPVIPRTLFLFGTVVLVFTATFRIGMFVKGLL